jgi:hypothetical protein
MESLKMQLPKRWVKFARSSSSVVITALTCLALAFAPFYLFVLGREGASFTDWRVISSFASIVLFPLVYIRLAALVIHQLRTGDDSHDSKRSAANRFISVVFWTAVAGGAVTIYFWLRP